MRKSRYQDFLGLICALILGMACAGASAQDTANYSWRYYRPGNTGIQGDFNYALWVAPDGDPYISGYDPFFGEGGFSKFIQSENRWVNYSNVNYPAIGHPDIDSVMVVWDIVPDAMGRLWMGTGRGALRFDPAVGPDSLTRFTPANSLLVDERTFDVERAPDGTMWFANNGMVRYNPATDTWTQWATGNEFISAQPKPGGGYLIWSSTRPPFQNYTFIFDSVTEQFTTIDVVYPNGNPGDVAGMPGKDCVDDAGNFWALRLTNPGDFDTLDYRQPDGTWVSPTEPYPEVTFSINAFKAYGIGEALLVDGAGTVWHFNGSAWSSFGQWRLNATTTTVDIDSSGNVWVSGVGGAARRDAQTGQWQRYRLTNTANIDSFNRDLTIDPVNGYVYAGANAAPGVGGMVRFDGTRWTNWNQLTYGLGYDWPFLNDYCDALAYRPSNASVAVSPSWLYGIHEWTGSGFNMLAPDGGTKRMCEDSLSRLWALGESNLSYFDGSTWTIVSGGVTPGTYITLRADPELPGTVWTSMGDEFRRIDGGAYNFSRTIADFPGLTANTDTFLGLAVDANGFAWVGATAIYDGPIGQAGALIHIDSNTGAYEIFRSALGWPFPGVLVTPWAVTPDGRVWMQYDTYYPYTVRGVLWFDGANVGSFPAPPDGAPQWGGVPHGQIEDLEVRIIPNGYELWMSCVSRGIAVLTVTYGSCPSMTLSPALLPNGTTGSAYTQTITTSGGMAPYTYAVSSGNLPDGLTFDPSTGIISGTPTVAALFHFTITATDANNCTGSHIYALDIHCPAIAISPVSLSNGQAGVAYNQTLSASGGTAPYNYAATAGSLPGGLSLNATTGAISGTPTTLGTFPFTITATDANGCAGSRDYTVNVSCPVISISPATLPDGQLGVTYNEALSASGGTAPYTYTVTSGGFPPGLTLDPSTGIISGTPSSLGNFPLNITAVDALTCTRTISYVIVVTPVPCLFCDDFEDGVLAVNWTYVKPNWVESGGFLQGAPAGKKAIAVASPVFAGCAVCTVQTTMRTAGGPFNMISMYTWYVDKKNTFELIMKEGNDRWLLKQRSGGFVVGKAKAISPIDPNIDYNVEVSYNGADVTVTVDGLQVITYHPVGIVPVGTIGYTARRTTGSFKFIQAN